MELESASIHFARENALGLGLQDESQMTKAVWQS